MKRALMFIGAFVGTLVIVFLLVFGFNLEALETLFRNSEDLQEGQEWVAATGSLQGLTEYIGANPAHVSIASFSLADPDSVILYNEHAPRTMGRMANILYLAAYAREVENGRLDADEMISTADINRYQLPYKDATDHEEVLASLEAEGGIRLENLVRAAVKYKDLAMADYLYFRLGRDRIEEAMNDIGLEETELPLPFSGLYIALNPHLHGKGLKFQSHLDSLGSVPRDTFALDVIDKARRFVSDSTFRKEVLSTFREFQGMGIRFGEERDALGLFPKTTAWEMAVMMRSVQKENLLSGAVSRRMKEYLDWSMQNTQIQRSFTGYGAIYDNRLGMAGGIDYGTSVHTGDSFAQAVFFDELQIAFWFHMTSNLMHQDFQQRLMWDPALWNATKNITAGER